MSNFFSFDEDKIKATNLSYGGKLFLFLKINSFSKNLKGSSLVIWFITSGFRLYVWK